MPEFTYRNHSVLEAPVLPTLYVQREREERGRNRVWHDRSLNKASEIEVRRARDDRHQEKASPASVRVAVPSIKV